LAAVPVCRELGFVLDHGRRRVLHFNVSCHPTAQWVIQQLRETFPDHPAHGYLVLDNDVIFSAEVARAIARFGVHPQRAALQSPWQNGTAERFVGTVRRELLDHVIVLSEDHLRRLLREYVEYYNTERVHTSIQDAPEGRAVQEQPSRQAKVIGFAPRGRPAPPIHVVRDCVMIKSEHRSDEGSARMNNGYGQWTLLRSSSKRCR
jgi:transposase InsO family protein